MIFLTIGTHEPFDRLVRAVDDWCDATGRGAEVLGQITDRGAYTPRNFDWVAKLDAAAYRARCEAAPFIISHAGMGSIITAMTFGKPIVVLPRRGHLGETRNDHQYATAQRFGARPGVHVAMEEGALPDLLNKVAGNGSAGGATLGAHAEERLIEALRNFINRR